MAFPLLTCLCEAVIDTQAEIDGFITQLTDSYNQVWRDRKNKTAGDRLRSFSRLIGVIIQVDLEEDGPRPVTRAEYEMETNKIFIYIKRSWIVKVFAEYNSALMKELSSVIADFYTHERVHQVQQSKRGDVWYGDSAYQDDGTVDVRSYLGDKDEIMAYAQDVATVLIRVYKTPSAALNKIKYNLKETLEHSRAFSKYHEVFGTNSPEFKRLLKYIASYLSSR